MRREIHMSDVSEKPYVLRRPGGEPDARRVFNLPGVVLATAVATALMFLLMVVAPARAVWIIENGAGFAPVRFFAGPAANGGWLGMFSPLVGHMFVHASLAHLLFNMLWFVAFGAPVARRMGAEHALKSFAAFSAAGLFLTFYFLSGIVGALTFALFHMTDVTLLVGASGGVSGLLGAVVRFAFNRTSLFGPEASRFSGLASSSVLLWSGFVIISNLAVGLYGASLTGGASIAWEAHIGGYLFGLVAYPGFERLARAFR